MTINVGTVDRVLRGLLGIALLALPFLMGFGTTGTVISVVVGLVMLATAAMRFCPAYTLLGIKTCRS